MEQSYRLRIKGVWQIIKKPSHLVTKMGENFKEKMKWRTFICTGKALFV